MDCLLLTTILQINLSKINDENKEQQVLTKLFPLLFSSLCIVVCNKKVFLPCEKRKKANCTRKYYSN